MNKKLLSLLLGGALAVPLLAGCGALTVYGYVNNSVGGSGDLTIDDGVLNVTAVNDGIKSKENIALNGGVLTVLSGGDAIRADGDLAVTGGAIRLSTGVGWEAAKMKVSDSLFMGGGSPETRWDMDDSSVSRKGLKADGTITVPEIQAGETYTLTVGDQVYTIEMTANSFSNRSRGGFGGRMSGGSREAGGETAGENT